MQTPAGKTNQTKSVAVFHPTCPLSNQSKRLKLSFSERLSQVQHFLESSPTQSLFPIRQKGSFLLRAPLSLVGRKLLTTITRCPINSAGENLGATPETIERKRPSPRSTCECSSLSDPATGAQSRIRPTFSSTLLNSSIFNGVTADPGAESSLGGWCFLLYFGYLDFRKEGFGLRECCAAL